MYPIICHLGPLTVYSYGVMLAVAAVVCSVWMSRDARRLNIPAEMVFDFYFWVVLAGILGARIFYVLLNWTDYFQYNPVEVVMIQSGGLAWQGGLFLATLVGIFFVRLKGQSLLTWMDLAAPYVALGEAIGRIGCFLNGCCYGLPVSWGIYFPVHGDHLHPTQLYSTALLLLIFISLKIVRKHSQTPGLVFALYLMLAAVERFVVEFFRADHAVLYGGLSIFQLVTLVIFSAGIILGIVFQRIARR